MTAPSGPPSDRAAWQPWTPERPGPGVTCPACGLANQPGARVCRRCGLPIASPDDPLRGVTPGRVDIPGARGSGLSATFGLLIVVAALVVVGSLALSGDGFLSGGSQLGAAFSGDASAGSLDPAASGQPAATGAPGATLAPGATPVSGVPGTSPAPGTTPAPRTPATPAGIDWTCETGTIGDTEAGRWRLATVSAGPREGFDRITLDLERMAARTRQATNVTMAWSTPAEAEERYGVRPAGPRVLVLTFDPDIALGTPRAIDTESLEAEAALVLRSVDVLSSEDGATVLLAGIRGDGCARLNSPQWKRDGVDDRALVYLDVQSQ